jgi:hypothetical protein
MADQTPTAANPAANARSLQARGAVPGFEYIDIILAKLGVSPERERIMAEEAIIDAASHQAVARLTIQTV